jgi:hypothetical protein
MERVDKALLELVREIVSSSALEPQRLEKFPDLVEYAIDPQLETVAFQQLHVRK